MLRYFLLPVPSVFTHFFDFQFTRPRFFQLWCPEGFLAPPPLSPGWSGRVGAPQRGVSSVFGVRRLADLVSQRVSLSPKLPVVNRRPASLPSPPTGVTSSRYRRRHQHTQPPGQAAGSPSRHHRGRRHAFDRRDGRVCRQGSSEPAGSLAGSWGRSAPKKPPLTLLGVFLDEAGEQITGAVPSSIPKEAAFCSVPVCQGFRFLRRHHGSPTAVGGEVCCQAHPPLQAPKPTPPPTALTAGP